MTDFEYSIFLTGGIGDVIAIESYLSERQRHNLTTIYYASPKNKQLQKLFKSLPNYPNLKSHVTVWEDFSKLSFWRSKQHFTEQTHFHPPGVQRAEDWSIQTIFPLIEDGKIPYNHSSFVRYKIAPVDKFDLPSNIIVICPYSNSTINIKDRGFVEEDWDAVISYLQKTSMVGVVLNRGSEKIPNHPLLINLNNRTSFPEAIEVLKTSKGYIGIDTALSVLAAKLFSPPYLMVRSKNEYLYRYQSIYYQPKTDFSFIGESIKKLSQGKIKRFPYISLNKSLNICPNHGLAFQKDMSQSIPYDLEYWQNYCHREDTPIARRINAARTDVTEKYCSCVIDVGIGSGEFIKKSKIKVYGYDINPYGIKWLRERNLYLNIYNDPIPKAVDGWTLWDCLEHIPDHRPLFDKIRVGDLVFVSLPVFDDLMKIEESKHYKPNEHYYYFTPIGMLKYMAECGFDCQEYNKSETEAGRENIMTFVFKKTREITSFSFVRL